MYFLMQINFNIIRVLISIIIVLPSISQSWPFDAVDF